MPTSRIIADSKGCLLKTAETIPIFLRVRGIVTYLESNVMNGLGPSCSHRCSCDTGRVHLPVREDQVSILESRGVASKVISCLNSREVVSHSTVVLTEK